MLTLQFSLPEYSDEVQTLECFANPSFVHWEKFNFLYTAQTCIQRAFETHRMDSMCDVWTGQLTLTRDDKPSYKYEPKIVCKMTFGREVASGLRKEAGFYTRELYWLQGLHVPRFYGAFQGTFRAFGKPYNLTCMLIEHGELADADSLSELPWEAKMQVKDAILMIHEVGVKHCDFDLWHVIKSNHDGRHLIIDFDCAEKHECEREYEIVPKTFQLSPELCKCDEIYRACYLLDIWIPASVMFSGSLVPLRKADTTQKLANYIHENWKIPMEEAVSRSKYWLQCYYWQYSDWLEEQGFKFEWPYGEKAHPDTPH